MTERERKRNRVEILSDDVAKDEAPDPKRLLARAVPSNKGYIKEKESQEKGKTTTQQKRKQKNRDR